MTRVINEKTLGLDISHHITGTSNSTYSKSNEFVDLVFALSYVASRDFGVLTFSCSVSHVFYPGTPGLQFNADTDDRWISRPITAAALRSWPVNVCHQHLPSDLKSGSSFTSAQTACSVSPYWPCSQTLRYRSILEEVTPCACYGFCQYYSP